MAWNCALQDWGYITQPGEPELGKKWHTTPAFLSKSKSSKKHNTCVFTGWMWGKVPRPCCCTSNNYWSDGASVKWRWIIGGWHVASRRVHVLLRGKHVCHHPKVNNRVSYDKDCSAEGIGYYKLRGIKSFFFSRRNLCGWTSVLPGRSMDSRWRKILFILRLNASIWGKFEGKIKMVGSLKNFVLL